MTLPSGIRLRAYYPGRSTVLRVIASLGTGTVFMPLQDDRRRSVAVHPS